MNVPRPSRCVLVVLLPTALVSAWLLPGCDQPPPKAPARKSSQKHTGEYIAALASANAFCQAWRQRDVAVGKSLLSLRIKRTFPESRIHDALSGTGNPRHAAYEISHGVRAADASIAFRLRLFYRYTGGIQDRVESPVASIVLRRDEAGTWLVDRFPLLDELESPEVIVR